MPQIHNLHGLYAITAATGDTRQLADDTTQAILGGASLIQYRSKHSDPLLIHQQATTLLEVCGTYEVPLIINDYIDLAKKIGADGVHIGRHDANLAHAREMLGPRAIVGCSCYNRLDLALTAAQQCASYVAFGRFFPSITKPDAVTAHLSLLREAKRTLTIPLVAIGGILPTHLPQLLAAGADMAAVIQGIFGQPDPRAAATTYVKIFTLAQNQKALEDIEK